MKAEEQEQRSHLTETYQNLPTSPEVRLMDKTALLEPKKIVSGSGSNVSPRSLSLLAKKSNLS